MHTEAHLRFLRLGRLGRTSLGIAPDWFFGQLAGVALFSGLIYMSVAQRLDRPFALAIVVVMGMVVMAAVNVTVVVHEVGHAIVAALSGAHVKAIVLVALGGATVRGTVRSDSHARLTAAAGPLANLIGAAIFVLLLVLLNPDRPFSDILILNAAFQALNGLTNLVPFGKFDGARVFAPR